MSETKSHFGIQNLFSIEAVCQVVGLLFGIFYFLAAAESHQEVYVILGLLVVLLSVFFSRMIRVLNRN